MNSVQLIGRTTKDIELRYTAQTQTAVGTFALAVNRMKKEDGADFIRCKVWGKRAEIMEEYIKKGNMVGITGRIQTGSYESNGARHYTTEVVVENFYFIEQRHETASQPEQNDDAPEGFAYINEDLPF